MSRALALLVMVALGGCTSAAWDGIESVNAQTTYSDREGHTFSQGVGVKLRERQRYNSPGK